MPKELMQSHLRCLSCKIVANCIKVMNTPILLQTLIESIEALSLEDQALLFEQLYRRRIEKQRQEDAKETADTTDNTPATSKSNQPQNPLLMVPATLKNNPLFDEVLGYMEAYRRELNKETEVDSSELDAEAQAT